MPGALWVYDVEMMGPVVRVRGSSVSVGQQG